MKILLGTNQFQEIAGSELVIQEFAELYVNAGHDVVVCANFVGAPMKNMAERAGITTCESSQEINALEFDLVMVINQIVPLLNYEPSSTMRPATRFVFLHVDLNFELSQPGLVHEPLLADEIWLHSPEAKEYFTGEGLPESKIRLFHNAAPSRFWRPERAYNERLERVAIVSNHLPDELAALVLQLRNQGIEVTHYGREGDTYGRIGLKTLLNADVVISIGKTVPYCIASRTPVFIYDHFAGPGYLNADNMERAAWFNYSGRCYRETRSAPELAEELIEGYAASVAFMRDLSDQQREQYRLRPQLMALLDRVVESTQPNDKRLATLAEHRLAMRHERALAESAGMFYRMFRRSRLRVEHLKSQLT